MLEFHSVRGQGDRSVGENLVPVCFAYHVGSPFPYPSLVGGTRTGNNQPGTHTRPWGLNDSEADVPTAHDRMHTIHCAVAHSGCCRHSEPNGGVDGFPIAIRLRMAAHSATDGKYTACYGRV